MLRLLDMTVEYLHHIFCLRDILGDIVAYDLCLVVLVENLLLHDTLTHSGHLWAMLRIDDGRHDVSTESRTYLVELLLIVLVDKLSCLVLHLHVEVAYLKLGTVGCKTAEESRGDTWAEVAAYDSGTHEAYLWLLFLEEVDDKGRMWVGGVWEKSLRIEDMDAVDTIFDNLLLYAFKTRASYDTFKFHAKGIGELASFGKELEGYILYLCSLYFAVYEYVVHLYVLSHTL